MNAVNSSGDKVRKACCHIARIGLSVVVVGWRGVLEELLGVIFLTEGKCDTRVGGWPPPRSSFVRKVLEVSAGNAASSG